MTESSASPTGAPLSPHATRHPGASAEELLLVEALRRRDESAFTSLVERHHAALLRLAAIYVQNRAVAEEVVQETWLGVLRGIDRFEGRASLKTWICQILVNRAKTRGQREGRSIPFSALWDPRTDPGEPAVDPSRFLDTSDPEWPGDWVLPPKRWSETPEEWVLSQEFRAHLQRSIETLPPSQREVISLRDIQGWTSAEVCNVLGISETNQRVLLHRARSKVRQALERYFEGT